MTKKEILDTIDEIASTKETIHGAFKYDSFIDRYVETLCYDSTSIAGFESMQRLEVLKQLYQLYKDCGGLDEKE